MTSDPMNDDPVVLRLSKSEALVFFEWLAVLESSPLHPFNHPAEELVLWRIVGRLESALVEPFAPNYKELLDSARDRVKSNFSG